MWKRPVARAAERRKCQRGLSCQRLGEAETIGFEVEPLRRRMLLEGQDEISLTLLQEAAIAAFQIRDRAERPWLYG